MVVDAADKTNSTATANGTANGNGHGNETAAKGAPASAGASDKAASGGCCGKRKAGGKDGKEGEKESEEPEVKVPFSRLVALCRDKAALFPMGVVCSSLVGGIMPCFGAPHRGCLPTPRGTHPCTRSLP